MRKRNTALKLAGAVAIATAGYHAYEGDRIINDMELNPDDLNFVSATFQLGSLGWACGGVLLAAAASFSEQAARSWVVGVSAVLYGFPSLGTLAMTGGEVNIGGLMLAATTGLALYGRKLDPTAETSKERRYRLQTVQP